MVPPSRHIGQSLAWRPLLPPCMLCWRGTLNMPQIKHVLPHGLLEASRPPDHSCPLALCQLRPIPHGRWLASLLCIHQHQAHERQLHNLSVHAEKALASLTLRTGWSQVPHGACCSALPDLRRGLQTGQVQQKCLC